MLFAETYATGELWAHALVAPTVYTIVVLATTRRGRKRRAWMALAVGWLFHILLDGMWLNQEVFLWPFFGLEMPTGVPTVLAVGLGARIERPMAFGCSKPPVWPISGGWHEAGQLHRPERRGELMATGRLVLDEV